MCVEKKLDNMKKEIRNDIGKVDQNVLNLWKTLLDVSNKLSGSYEEILKQKEKNEEQDKILRKHDNWLFIHSAVIFFLFLIVVIKLLW